MKSTRRFLIILVLLLALGLVSVSMAAAGQLSATGTSPAVNPPPPPAIEAGDSSKDSTSIGASVAGSWIILYDQTDSASGNGAPDQDFEAANDMYDSEGADDFGVPASGWSVHQINTLGISGGTANSVDINFYPDNAGFPDTTPICSYNAISITMQTAGNFEIALPAVCELAGGTYWVAIQTNQDFATDGQHFWANRSVQSNSESVWRNPNDGFGTGCTDWDRQTTCGVGGGASPDFLFQILGDGSITLAKTVGTDPGACATTDAISVPYGSDVTYCYMVENTSNVATLNIHDLVDSELGTILSDFPFPLGPGAAAFITQTTTIFTHTVNTATWTANAGDYTVDDTVPYNFEDISATGNALTLSDDQVSAPIPLGFTFNFYGTDYTAIHVGSNGFLTVLGGQTSGCCSGQPIPTAGSPNGIIAGWWENLDPPAGGGVTYQMLGSAPNRYFIVQFTDIQHFPSGTPVTFQYKLFEGSNEIEVHYLTAASDGGTHAAGVENQTGTLGTQYFLGTTSLSAPLAVRYAPTLPATATDTASVTVLFPNIDTDPALLASSLGFNRTVTYTLSISNVGTLDLDWNIIEGAPALRSIPASDGNFPRGDFAPSIGAVPGVEATGSASAGSLASLLGSPAYGLEYINLYYTVFDINKPEVLPMIAPFPGLGPFIGAGEYVAGLVYMLDQSNNMWEIDPSNGAILNAYTATAPLGGETYTGLAFDTTDGKVYAASTNIVTSTLFTMDVSTGSTTTIGPITGAPCMIGLAADGAGDLWGYDICNDELVSINKATGAGTVIGSIGFDANFGQGIGWDGATDTLYMAAFNAGTFQPELRAVDRTTGNTALIGVLGATTPGGTPQVTWLGFDQTCLPGDIPWVSSAPNSGTTSAGGSTLVDVIFDSSAVTQAGTYTGTLCVSSNDPFKPTVQIPVMMNVQENYLPIIFKVNTP